MQLTKVYPINVLTYDLVFNPNTGLQTYTYVSTVQQFVSIFPFKRSRVPDFQVDTIRFMDHWVIIGNTQIPDNENTICQLMGDYYSIVYEENTRAMGNGVGYFKNVIKLGVDQAYGVS